MTNIIGEDRDDGRPAVAPTHALGSICLLMWFEIIGSHISEYPGMLGLLGGG